MTNSSITISIITIAFNSEKTIRKTIESVLNQSYSGCFEYIIIDGQSSDQTLEIALSYMDKFRTKNIKYSVISEKDSGISDAFNKGIKYSSGSIIGIINSDDQYDKFTIDTIINSYESKFKIYCGDIGLLDKYGAFIRTRKSKPHLLNFGMYVLHPSVFISRDLYLNDLYDTSLKIAMDYDLILRLKKKSYKIKKINSVLAFVTLGGVSSNIIEMRSEEKKVMKRHVSKYHFYLSTLKIKFDTLIHALISRY